MRRVQLRPRAEDDLRDIWTYTVQAWSEAQAAGYLSGLNAALRLLAEFPDVARLRAEFTPVVRLHPYREHLVVFLATEDALDVLRVVHRKAHWAGMLAE